MAFSLRSFFGKEKSPEGPTPFGGSFQAPAPTDARPPTPASIPFGGGGTPTGSPFTHPPGQPVGSPFSPFAVAGAGAAGLTVEDILPLLPQDVAKDPRLPPGQPLQISEE